MPHLGATLSSETWWLDPPGSDNCVTVELRGDEIVIWQYRNGEIASVHLDRGTARDIAAYLLHNL